MEDILQVVVVEVLLKELVHLTELVVELVVEAVIVTHLLMD
tara:strand:- start:35 stop:157 length:123 start_codon:yes stop_codon:yes gene_type:complete